MIQGLKTTSVLAFLFTPLVIEAQVGGSLVEFPPLDITLEISETTDGRPVISMDTIELVTGEYYRLNVTSSGETDWRLEMPDLLQNSHLRLVTVNDGIEIHLQSMVCHRIRSAWKDIIEFHSDQTGNLRLYYREESDCPGTVSRASRRSGSRSACRGAVCCEMTWKAVDPTGGSYTRFRVKIGGSVGCFPRLRSRSGAPYEV